MLVKMNNHTIEILDVALDDLVKELHDTTRGTWEYHSVLRAIKNAVKSIEAVHAISLPNDDNDE